MDNKNEEYDVIFDECTADHDDEISLYGGIFCGIASCGGTICGLNC